MLGWERDVEVRDESLAIPGMLKISICGSCCSRNEMTEEAIGLGIYNDATVVDDGLCGDSNGSVTGSPRVEGKSGTHQDFPVPVERFA